MTERSPHVYNKGKSYEKLEDPTRCVEEVFTNAFGGWSRFHAFQCSRKRGFGKDGLYCKQHAKRHPVEAEAK